MKTLATRKQNRSEKALKENLEISLNCGTLPTNLEELK